jgi:hypothetical protein
MTVTNGQSQKKLVLHPPTKSLINTKIPIWVGQEEGEENFQATINPLLTIETTLSIKKLYEDIFISNYMKNLYPSSIKIEQYTQQWDYKDIKGVHTNIVHTTSTSRMNLHRSGNFKK